MKPTRKVNLIAIISVGLNWVKGPTSTVNLVSLNPRWYTPGILLRSITDNQKDDSFYFFAPFVYTLYMQSSIFLMR